jgi:hypothetical protein
MSASIRYACTVGLVGTLFWLTPLPAHAGPPADFNGDGKADLAIGVPGEQVGSTVYAGAVTVIYGSDERLTSSHSQMWRLQDFGIAAGVGDLFGASLAWADFNGDTMTDLVIGVPGARRVIVMYGASGRLSAERHQTFNAVTGCDWYGGALATGNFDGDAYPDLVVGAPLCQSTKGLAFVYSGGEERLEFLQKTLTLTDFSLQQKTYDHFGAALAAGDFNGDGFDDLAVGIPGRDQTSIVVDIGAVAIYHGRVRTSDPTSSFLAPRRIMHQENGGTHVNEAGDHFGEVLAAGNFNGDAYDDLAVGVPLEDVGGVVNAGEVTIYIGRGSGGLLPQIGHSHLNQNSASDWAALADVAEEGDEFGASLAAADFDGDGILDLAIGVPFEDIGGVVNAGAVHVLRGLYLSGLTLTGSKLFHQDANNVLDACERGDAFGLSLTAGDYDGNGYADLAIGVPGEDFWTAQDTGAMQVLYGRSNGVGAPNNQIWTQASAGIPDHPEPWDVFGAGTYGHVR